MEKTLSLMFLAVFISACNCGSIPASAVDGGVGCQSDLDCSQPCADLGYSKAICANGGICVCIDTRLDAGTPQAQCSAISRASLAKMVIVAIDGLATYQAPKTPTFDDVRPNSWYYDYVEATVQLGIMEGVINTGGNLSFFPSNQVSRAQTIKVVITAIDGLANYTVPVSPTFADVARNAWYFDYVEAAVQLGLIDRATHFFPADLADECWSEKVFLRVGLRRRLGSVTMVNNGPAAQAISRGATNVPVLNFSLTATQNLSVIASRLEIRIYDNLGNVVSDDAVYSLIRNVRVVDTDLGSTLCGPVSKASDGQRRQASGGSWVWYSHILPEDFDLVANVTGHYAVVVDVDGTFPTGHSFDVKLSLRPEDAPWTSFVKKREVNGYLVGDRIIGDPLMSQRITVQ